MTLGDNDLIRRIKDQLEQSDRQPVPLPPILSQAGLSADPVELFREQVVAVGGHCTVVPNERAARAQLADISAAKALEKLSVTDNRLVMQVLADPIDDVAVGNVDQDRDTLFSADAGVTGVQWGIAETGTLVLASSSEKNRLVSLVPPIHIAIIHAANIVPTMLDVLQGIQNEDDRHQAITFITGPSRTADIELTLVVGVHGPKELHVIVIDDPNSHAREVG